jgi:hypothetical protein
MYYVALIMLETVNIVRAPIMGIAASANFGSFNNEIS